MPGKIGVLAIQGDFTRHTDALLGVGVPPSQLLEVRTEADLGSVERLVIPGGESTTVGMLLDRYGLGSAIKARVLQGMPVWGTCMGMILMAAGVEATNQYTLGILDIEVRRNAFGAQVHSFEEQVSIAGFEKPVTGVFIRAPIVVSHGPSVEPLATCRGSIVAVRQGSLVGTSFHPELTEDHRMHEWFLSL